jgi:ribosomal protein S18 acetylase RimI-like enzyme
LEALAGASWYVNVLATFKDFRCQGMGSLLLNHVEQLAIDSGCRDMSLIVSSNNTSARNLYQSLGYQTRACRPSVPFPDSGSIGKWELMMKAL